MPDHPDQPVLLVESRAVFRRRRLHRQKAHLVLSALRHRAAELGDQAVYVRADTYAEALAGVGEPLDVCAPTAGARPGPGHPRQGHPPRLLSPPGPAVQAGEAPPRR